jgi:hypothetical protein
MNAKKCWISTVIVLAVYVSGFFNMDALAAEKNSYQQKSVIVSPNQAGSRVPENGAGDTAFSGRKQRTLGFSALTFHTTFSEAIDILRNSTDPPLKIVVMWRDLSENAYVEPDTPIKIDGVSGIRLRTALELLLLAVSSGVAKLEYVVKDGVIIIATRDSLPDKMVTRVYDVSDLLAPPARFGFGFAPPFAAGWPGRAYMGPAGQWDVRYNANSPAYGRGGRRRSRRGTIAEWGQGQNGQRAGRISNMIRNTVRPDRWR